MKNDDLERLKEGLKLHYEMFRNSCDALEEEGVWPLEELGEMDTYFSMDLSCVIIRLIMADGQIQAQELDKMNDVLGMDLTVAQLQDTYRECGDRIHAFFESELANSLRLLEKCNAQVAGEYRQMLEMLCRIIIECDGFASPEEQRAAQQLKAQLG